MCVSINKYTSSFSLFLFFSLESLVSSLLIIARDMRRHPQPRPRTPDRLLPLPSTAPPCLNLQFNPLAPFAPLEVALTVFYRTPSLLYLYQSHWPWTPPISARHYATTTSTTSTTTSTTTTQNSDCSAYATLVKSQPKSLSKKRMVSPRERRRLT